MPTRAGRSSLPLAGLPLAIKDNVPVQASRCAMASTASDPAPQAADHEVVRRLRAAGAVVVGLTRVPELCVFGATDSRFGVTRNPGTAAGRPAGRRAARPRRWRRAWWPWPMATTAWARSASPRPAAASWGSSPGRASCPRELGNGSWFGMAENGPLATTVADCALLLSVMAGRPELADRQRTRPGPGRRLDTAPAPLIPVDRHWAAAVRETGALLRGGGHGSTRPTRRMGNSSRSRGSFAGWRGPSLTPATLADRAKLEARTRRHAALGRTALRLGLPREGGRRRWRQAAEIFFAHHDVLVTPALAQPPIDALAWSQRTWLANVVANVRFAPFAAPWNLAGWPAMAVPAGMHPDGTPLSVQLVARPGGEQLLLAVARQLESVRPWPRTAPAPV